VENGGGGAGGVLEKPKRSTDLSKLGNLPESVSVSSAAECVK